MKNNLKKYFVCFLCFTMLLRFIGEAQALGAFDTIALFSNDDEELHLLKSWLLTERPDLKILSVAEIATRFKNSNLPSLPEDQKVLALLREIDAANELYYSWTSGNMEMLERWQALQAAIVQCEHPSPVLDLANVALYFNRAKLLLELKQQDQAVAILENLFRLAPKLAEETDYYQDSPLFKKIIEQALRNALFSDENKTKIQIRPKALPANVSLDHIPIGTAPSSWDISPGKHWLTVYSPGRKTWHRQINIKEGKNLVLNPHLDWNNEENSFHSQSWYEDWSHLKEHEKQRLARHLIKTLRVNTVIVSFSEKDGSRWLQKIEGVHGMVSEKQLWESKSDFFSIIFKTKSKKKSPVKKPLFWAVLGGLVLTGAVAGIVVLSGNESNPTGSVAVGF